MKLSSFRLFEQAAAIFRKDFLVGLRKRAAFAAMAMFALTAIAAVFLGLAGISGAGTLTAALTGAEFVPEFLLAMIFYDAVLVTAASILYDFLD